MGRKKYIEMLGSFTEPFNCYDPSRFDIASLCLFIRMLCALLLQFVNGTSQVYQSPWQCT